MRLLKLLSAAALFPLLLTGCGSVTATASKPNEIGTDSNSPAFVEKLHENNAPMFSVSALQHLKRWGFDPSKNCFQRYMIYLPNGAVHQKFVWGKGGCPTQGKPAEVLATFYTLNYDLNKDDDGTGLLFPIREDFDVVNPTYEVDYEIAGINVTGGKMDYIWDAHSECAMDLKEGAISKVLCFRRSEMPAPAERGLHSDMAPEKLDQKISLTTQLQASLAAFGYNSAANKFQTYLTPAGDTELFLNATVTTSNDPFSRGKGTILTIDNSVLKLLDVPVGSISNGQITSLCTLTFASACKAEIYNDFGSTNTMGLLRVLLTK